VCRKSIEETVRKVAPKNRRKLLLVKYNVFIIMMKIDTPIIIDKNSITKWNNR